MPGLTDRFWRWYALHEERNIAVAAALFALQLVHLTWLTLDVVVPRLLDWHPFAPPPYWELLIVAVDYTEIPAIIGTSLVYLYDLRRSFHWKGIAFLLFLNIQWLHLFWITDEFVVNAFEGNPGTVLPLWLAWVAIVIDYLELPVIVDTFRRVVRGRWKSST
ncbi:MAG: Uncharacterized protein Greene041619_659 [Candidatus Peregrinibacteria bacterium Greene0416_19]|nr:MAG: Uncharacterized protein Greene041619_659 [Candidatus Peregrinibacteria bacterium Greene0416_19]